MPKLRLDLDALDVDSFDLAGEAAARGTAHAHRAAFFAEGATRDTNCIVTCDPGYDTCGDTCVGLGVCPPVVIEPASGGVPTCEIRCFEPQALVR